MTNPICQDILSMCQDLPELPSFFVTIFGMNGGCRGPHILNLTSDQRCHRTPRLGVVQIFEKLLNHNSATYSILHIKFNNVILTKLNEMTIEAD